MSLHYFTHQSVDGRWHTVYCTPGCVSLTSAMDAGSERAAREEAANQNRLQARQEEASQQASLAPADRPIPRGFYNDGDAA